MKNITEEEKIKAIHYLAKKLQQKKLKDYGLEIKPTKPMDKNEEENKKEEG